MFGQPTVSSLCARGRREAIARAVLRWYVLPEGRDNANRTFLIYQYMQLVLQPCNILIHFAEHIVHMKDPNATKPGDRSTCDWIRGSLRSHNSEAGGVNSCG